MNKIDEFFEKYPKNIIGFRVNGGVKIIDIWFDIKWKLLDAPEGIEIKKQKTNEEKTLNYYLVHTSNFDFDKLYNFCSSIIEHNLDMEKKQDLFNKKLDEMKQLFINLSYDELTKLTFEPNKEKTVDLTEEHKKSPIPLG